jgi:hypothetical protein
MLTEREAAERNTKRNYVLCYECPLVKKCKKIYGLSRTFTNCQAFSKQWLADHPVDFGWKDFVLSNLPDLTEVYDFQKAQGEGVEFDWFNWEMDNSEAVENLFEGELLRYRKRQPEQKQLSHKKIMENIWFVDKSGWMKVDYFNIDDKGFKYHFPVFNKGAFLRASDFSDMKIWSSMELEDSISEN